MFNPSRDQVRQFFCTAWRKYRERQPLAGAEVTAADLVARHPEYHPLLDNETEALTREWTPEGGQMNPFLHLSLHLAIHEQLSIDQPRGIVAAFQALCRKMPHHDAEHVLLETLGEIVWRTQSRGETIDPETYVEEIRRKAGQA